MILFANRGPPAARHHPRKRAAILANIARNRGEGKEDKSTQIHDSHGDTFTIAKRYVFLRIFLLLFFPLLVRFSCLFFAQFILVGMSSSGHSLEQRFVQQKQWKKLRKTAFSASPFAFLLALAWAKSSRSAICLHSNIFLWDLNWIACSSPGGMTLRVATEHHRLRLSTHYKLGCFMCTWKSVLL